MGKISFLAGGVVGYVLGTRAGEKRYEQIKKQADKAWQNPAVQEKVTAATEQVKTKAPAVAAAVGQKAADAGKSAGQAAAAKAGDVPAAARLAREYVDQGLVDRLRAVIGDRMPVLVPVLAQEATGRNKIPQAYAYALGSAMGLEVSDDIVQTVRALHTGARAFHRLAFQPVFEGPVVAGQDYVIVDDAITMAGTLTNLRGHIEANGGRVVAAGTPREVADGAGASASYLAAQLGE